jgi:hypothetical protein
LAKQSAKDGGISLSTIVGKYPVPVFALVGLVAGGIAALPFERVGGTWLVARSLRLALFELQ